MPTVFVVSPLWDLRGAVRAELLHAGVNALGMESIRDLADAIADGTAPSLVIVDGDLLHDAASRNSLGNLSRWAHLLVIDSSVSPAPAIPGSTVLQRPVLVRQVVDQALECLRKGSQAR